MSNLGLTAQRLRDVREAMRHFLTLWSLEQLRQHVHQGPDAAPPVDTAAIEAAIREMDVYGSDALLGAVLGEFQRRQ